jgi:hypothetical protein
MTRSHNTTSTHPVEKRGRTPRGERRGHGERRRNTAGLLEQRARREGIDGDRRQGSGGHESARLRLRALWRRVKS